MSKRPILFMIFTLALTLALDHGALPALEPAWRWLPVSEMRLMGLGVILVGLLRPGWETALYAMAAAGLHATAAGPGLLGPTMIGFWSAGLMAALLARWFFLQGAFMRLISLVALIALDSWASSAVRSAFWATSPVEIQWPVHVLAALTGVWLYGRIVARLRKRPEPPLPLGRKRR